MERTERFRGRLMAGDLTVIEAVMGLLKSHPRHGGAVGEWTGYFEFPPDRRASLVEGNRYRLVLIDGRSGHVNIQIPEHDALDRSLAIFHGTGSFRR